MSDAPEDLARVILHCGRQFLVIGGFVLAMEGDKCRDADNFPNEDNPFIAQAWTPEMLERAAKSITAAADNETSRLLKWFAAKWGIEIEKGKP